MRPGILLLVFAVNGWAGSDPLAELNRKIQAGETRLKFDPANGYLRGLLDALGIPVESQLAVYSKTSFEPAGIGPHNPRSVFFNDSAAVTWQRGAWRIEVAAQDPERGVVFYTLYQALKDKPAFERRDDCMTCHSAGMLVRSGEYETDHTSPIGKRWGGWYVTGKSGGAAHMGNLGVAGDLASLDGKIDVGAYLSKYSDIVALMVFDHQMRAMNLIAGAGRSLDAANALADYLMFVDEAPLTGKIEGSSGFDRKFSAEGPRDAKGRSLRQFDLETRLMRYGCSYMIYSAAFDGLPAATRAAVYKRMWGVLSGRKDRQEVIEILRATKAGLPDYFQ